jgi:DNA repair protein RadA/Sms
LSTKTKTAYVCSDCGSEYRKWQGQCNDCKAWNTLTEVRLGSATRSSSISRTGFAAAVDGQVKTLSEITLDEIPRISTSVGELDLVLGGGLVPGSVILVGR